MSSPAIETSSVAAPAAPLIAFGKKERKVMSDPLMDNNPITVQVLGICSALAVTIQLNRSLVMAAAVIAVLAMSNVIISMIRSLIPSEHPDHRAAVGHRVAGHRRRPGPAGLSVRHQQAAVGLRRPDHHELHRDGSRRGLRHGQPALAVVPRRTRQRPRLRRNPHRRSRSSGSSWVRGACSVSQVVPQAACTTSATPTTGSWYSHPGAFIILGLMIWAQRTWTGYVEEA